MIRETCTFVVDPRSVSKGNHYHGAFILPLHFSGEPGKQEIDFASLRAPLTQILALLRPPSVRKSSDSDHDATAVGTAEEIEKQFQRELAESRARSSDARKARLEMAATKPRQVTVTTKVFVRNADVVLEVLERANGRCELCSNTAPFKKTSDGEPYLEVHHRKPLAQDGEDTVANAIALCPNCHRKAHFG
jgi:hypothetical protein